MGLRPTPRFPSPAVYPMTERERSGLFEQCLSVLAFAEPQPGSGSSEGFLLQRCGEDHE